MIRSIICNNFINKIRLERRKKKDRNLYQDLNGNREITILAPNCIAGEIYNILGLRFNSPLINSSMKRRDFIEFVSNLDEYLKIDPIICGHEKKHPIISLKSDNLKEIKIRFLHDSNDEIVLKNWNKRKARIIKDELFIICDCNELTDEDIDKLNNIKSKKFVEKNRYEKYQYKKLNGIYKFMDFFDYINFLAK